MNCVPSTVLPDPEGPATSRLSPSGMPPPISASSSGMPVESRRRPLTWPDFFGEAEGAREGLHAGLGDAEGVQAGHGLLAAQLHDLQLAHDRVPLDALVEPEQPVGDGEDRVVAQLALDVLADQERGRLPTGQVQRQALDEALELHFARVG